MLSILCKKTPTAPSSILISVFISLWCAWFLESTIKISFIGTISFFRSCYSMDETKNSTLKEAVIFPDKLLFFPFYLTLLFLLQRRVVEKKIRKPWLLSLSLPYNVEGNLCNPSEMHFGKKKNSLSFFKNLVWGLNTIMIICYSSNSEAGNQYLLSIFQIYD